MRGLYLLSIIFLASGVFALSGVTPSSYSINFEGSLSENYTFEFVFDEGVLADLYLEGDLSSYASLDKEYIVGQEAVTLSLNLPNSIDVPGTHYLFVGAKQRSRGSSGVGLAFDTRGILKIEVPYPGRYVELEIKAFNANVGEMANFSVTATNKGSEEINFSPMIQIFKNDTFFASYDLEPAVLDVRESEDYFFQANTSEFESGEYLAIAIADYGEEKLSRGDDNFRLGEFKVFITDYTKDLNGGGIEPFSIDVESNYNDFIPRVYADVNLVGADVKGFSTPEISLDPFGKGTLEGFFDTSLFDDGDFSVEIVLHYGDEESSNQAFLSLIREGEFGVYYVSFISLLVLVGIIIYFLKVFRKVKRPIKGVK